MGDAGAVHRGQFVGPGWMASMDGVLVGDHSQRMGDEIWKSVPRVRVELSVEGTGGAWCAKLAQCCSVPPCEPSTQA